MADRIKVFPLIALGAVVIMGIVLYLVTMKSRPSKVDPPPLGNPPPPEARPEPKGAVQAPPPTNDPGQKILDGADGAFRSGMFPTALKFYKDFELRYAGTEVYDRNISRVWERIHTSHASTPKEKQDPETPAYLEARRKLAEEWKKIKPLTASPPTPESRAEAEKFLSSLPPQDGRRKIIDAWRDGK
ncbi:MAG: hypothetical protein HY293_20775 [Planctomycetes bacterium]|nr:hypothetical protein [Planctomycetota bacterium]